MKADSIKIQYPEDMNKMEIVLSMNKSHQHIQKIEKLKEVTEKGKLLAVDIKQYRQKRSLNANSYCWILADKIAEKLETTKEKVYREIIKDVGQFEVISIQNNAVENFKKVWESNGLGWQVELLSEDIRQGFTDLIAYYGSSVYDTKAMSILLEELIVQANELGIDTMTPDEKEKLLQMWEERYEKN